MVLNEGVGNMDNHIVAGEHFADVININTDKRNIIQAACLKSNYISVISSSFNTDL